MYIYTYVYIYINEYIDPVPVVGCLLHQGEAVDSGPVLTQGDKLRALKSRRLPRAATTGALRVEEVKVHSRSASQPLR
ncbi:Dual specificity protein phosphatase CDC14A [Liparis tanakae]|uniref:Dual specificity protein phosphatase CDC14A n=1 Tax=Liparis tanakae TaxID=230148 RepID=A0A4Z2E8X0_9TELE|nr:Dual specificity protein phosphatase CDC14A [Liparis tanakae]